MTIEERFNVRGADERTANATTGASKFGGNEPIHLQFQDPTKGHTLRVRMTCAEAKELGAALIRDAEAVSRRSSEAVPKPSTAV